jgi:nitroimidazol reductase NimA-like FMN-containing flavoprotein (pyridoxamine 5'-phosphate oxidase superfamily)
MVVNEMTENDCAAFLASATLGRLGCSKDSQPYVVPVRFAYEPGFLYVLSTSGRKIEWMRLNPQVCLQVDNITNQSQWTSVIASGRYQELVEPRHTDEIEHARKLLAKSHNWWQNALGERQLRVGDGLISPLFFRICIDSVTGLRAVDESAGTGNKP